MLKYANRHLWRKLESALALAYPSDEPTQVRTRFLVTAPCIVRAASLNAGGEVQGEPFLVGVLQPGGDGNVEISHGVGVAVSVELPKGTEVWVYDDREPTVAMAPVGESFTRFEKIGQREIDPLQVIIHRDNVRKRLERMAAGPVPDDPRIAELQQMLASASERLAKLEAPGDANDDDQDGVAS